MGKVSVGVDMAKGRDGSVVRRIYPITPYPKPRMTRSDKWKKRPEVLRYRAFCDEVSLRKVELPPAGASIHFVLPMPASWTNKKKASMNGQPHQQKPDIDNLLKALADACHQDDAHIWNYSGLTKTWGESGQIIIIVGGE